MNETGQAIFGIFGVVYLVVVLAAIVWGFYSAYLITRALRKYLRT